MFTSSLCDKRRLPLRAGVAAACAIFVHLCLTALSVTAAAAEAFPSEFIEYAKGQGCRPLTDKPYYWGAVKGTGEKDSAVFWCETKEDATHVKTASMVIYFRSKAPKSFSCPRVIKGQDIGDELEVWEPGRVKKKPQPLSELHYMNSDKRGPQGRFADGYVIENIISRGTAGALFYCHNGRWMSRSYC